MNEIIYYLLGLLVYTRLPGRQTLKKAKQNYNPTHSCRPSVTNLI